MKPPRKLGWRLLRWGLIGLAVLVTLAALLITEENWRGKHDWEKTKAALEAKGAVLDWNKYIPPPVPDDQNFFAAPKMQEWFVKKPSSFTNGLIERLQNPDTTATNLNEAAAAKYLAWSDQFQPDFDLIRQALKRPYARMAGDYSKPYAIPIPNFVAVRIVAQVMAQRARCHLTLNQPAEALQDVTFLHDLCRLLEAAPTHKPMTLVAAMINVAVTGLYADVVAEGLRSDKWQAPQLAVLQTQLLAVNLAPFVAGALDCEPVGSVSFIQTKKPSELYNLSAIVTGPPKNKATLWDKIRSLKGRWWDFTPRGWVYQNVASLLKASVEIRASLFDDRMNVTPRKIDLVHKRMEDEWAHPHLFNCLAAIAIPNYDRAMQTFAFNQTKANEAQIVCALERYRLANGRYPETLAALTPRFMEKIPPDLIGGQPLHYRPTADGKFLLYSVGWNETDDDGLPGTLADANKGDWVWQN